MQWEREEWGTASGRRSRDTGERYLPEPARKALSKEEYRRTSARKRADSRAGRPVSRQPKSIAAKTAAARRAADRKNATKAQLMAEARRRALPGRSRMTRAALERALAASE